MILAIAAGGLAKLLKKGDLIQYRCPMTGTMALGIIIVCDRELLLDIVVHNIKEARIDWITVKNITRLVRN